MKQPTIEIADKHTSYGIKKVYQINWDDNGEISFITVNFGESLILLLLRDFSTPNFFINSHGNLFGYLNTK